MNDSTSRRISHDQYFKNLIIQYPRQALQFFDPKRADLYSEDVIITPIRQEMLMDRLGERFFELDVPLEIRWPDGRREYMLAVIEEETDPARFDIWRLVIYCASLCSLFRTQRLVPIVVFLREGRDIPPAIKITHESETFMHFHYVSVILPQLQAVAHMDSGNIVEQILLPTMSWSREDKVRIVGAAIRALIQLDSNIDNQLKFEKFIRTYAPLDEDEERQYKTAYALEDRHMLSIREELERKGELRGIQIGRKEGIQIGEMRGQRQTVARMLSRRFGPLGAETQARLEQATSDELDHWADSLLTAQTLEEVFQLQ